MDRSCENFAYTAVLHAPLQEKHFNLSSDEKMHFYE